MRPRAGKARCRVCKGLKIVAIKWPSGYPHCAPCPACRPNDPCDCGGVPGCPTPEAIAAWKRRRAERQKKP